MLIGWMCACQCNVNFALLCFALYCIAVQLVVASSSSSSSSSRNEMPILN
jgi:hypothetical protein